MPAAVTVDLTKLMKRFSAKELEAKQVKFAMSVAEDMNAFTPEDTKRMHNSMQAASDFRQGLVIWDADYAAYVRDLPDSSIKHGKNPRAKADWPKAAKEAHGEDWERLAVDLLTEGGVTWPPDVMEAAKASIEALGYGPVLLTRLAASRGHDDAVVLRPMPTADAVRHMDGTRRVGYVLQVIVKDTSEAKAMGDAYDLADALDGADLSSPTGSYGFTSAALYTEPQEITPPEGGPYLWEFRIKATITIEKG